MKSYLHLKGLVLVVVIFVASALNAFGQQHTVTGTVRDAQTSNTLPGVNILVKGTTIGTTTDSTGHYSINVPNNKKILRFTYVGYKTKSVVVGNRTTINVKLKPSTISGQQMVVVGYGSEKASNVTSSISSVSSKDFTQSAPSDAADLIKGKVAGLSINTPSGNPASGSQIRLRGTSSLLASNNPLVLVDGVPGNLNTVAPENIKSISVLKGGAAAAIYGSRGSNGVILIQTKNNVKGRTSISYNGYVNVQTFYKTPHFLSASDVRKYDKKYPNLFHLKDYGHNTDWLRLLTRNPISQDHNLRFSGGSAKTNYTASLNYQRTEGIFYHSNNVRVRGRVNVKHSMFNNKLRANLNLIANSRHYATTGDGTSWNPLIYRNALTRNPTDRPKDSNGNYIYRSGFEEQNPLALLNENYGKNKNRRLRMDGTLTFNPIKSLSFKLLGSTNEWTQLRGYAQTSKSVATVKGGRKNYASRGASGYTSNELRFTGTFKNNFGGNSVKFLGGYDYLKDINDGFYMQNWNFPTDAYGYNRMQAGNALTQGKAVENSSKSSHKLISFFGRLNYNYKERYLLMASVRYEGNSKFGASHKWGVFPAVSAGWRISNENFMKNVNFLDNLKLRASFGVTGISPSATYAALPLLNYGAKIFSGGNWIQGLSPSQNPNPNLHWEQKAQTDIGIDFSMFNSRFSGSFDVYRSNISNLLHNYDVPVPPNLYPTILANVGKMRNEGFEAQLSYQTDQSHAFTWHTSATFSTHRNKLVSLSNSKYQPTQNYFYTGYTGAPIQLPTHIVKVGQAIGDFYGFKSVDISNKGQWIVLGKNGKRKLLGNASLNDRRVIGNGIPKYHVGFSNTFNYKNFDLDVNMYGAFGFQILNLQRMFYQNAPANPPDNFLKSSFNKIYGKHVINTSLAYVSHFVENGAYWKIHTVTLGYTFNVNAFKKYVKNIRVYGSVKNLLTITGYKGMDPEVNTGGLAPSVDSRDKYPTTRTFTLGLNLKF
ncbi:MAG TPA: SusC/RagA family TonB-linked outer membrane protein [Balneolaceae bacterium]|nr:SusC/RagA family TonB-linked outer membrane protein [Balneolaceae bacterium]